MTLILDLSPKVEARLRADAYARDMSVSEYVKMLMEGATPHRRPEASDPEIILNAAVRDMKANQIKNRELAVEALTQKNNLQAEVIKQERIVAELERKANQAQEANNRELSEQFLKEKQRYQNLLEQMQVSLEMATRAADIIKENIRREEERIRDQVSEALLLKTKLRHTQMRSRLDSALSQFQFNGADSPLHKQEPGSDGPKDQPSDEQE